MIDSIIENAHQLDFYKAVFVIENQLKCADSDYRHVGYDSHPKMELVKFSSVQKLGFPGNSISKVESNGYSDNFHQVTMHISFMGLTGCAGALPQFYTELVLQRIKYKDTAMRDFYDMFNHRLVSMYYRAWKKYKQPLSYVKAHINKDPYTEILTLLSGGEQLHHLHCSGVFNRKIRNATDLQQLLQYYLDCSVEINQMVGQWRELKPQEQTSLASIGSFEGQNAQLGVDSMLGQKVWDLSSQVDVEITCTKKDQASHFLPKGKLYQIATKILKDYLGHSIQYRLNINTRFEHFAISSLSKNNMQLGSSSFLAVRESQMDKETHLSFKG